MGIVGGTLFNGPVLHGFGDFIGYIQRQLAAGGNAMFPCKKNCFGQTLTHGGFIECICAKNFGNVQKFGHKEHPFI